MRNTLIYVVLTALLPLFTQAQSAKRAAIREIQLSGSGYELGVQHGKLLKKEIAELVDKMKANTTRALGKDAAQVINEFMQYAQFTDAIKQYTPDLYDEVRGIADGSQQALNDIMVFNLLDEFWVYEDNLANHHCSGVGVPASTGNPAYIAQNMDIESYTDGYQLLLRLSKTTTQPEQLILTHPGCIALNGMNEVGIGACMNTLMQLKASSKGLPVAFIVRRILSSTDKNELLQFIQSVPHASGQNYIIGIQDEVFDFEASANKVVRFDPTNANGTLYHTNHPLVNDDVKDWFAKPSLATEQSNSYIRLASVRNRIMGSPTVNDGLIKETLRAKDDPNNPVCRAPKHGGFTFVSVIMTLTGTPFLQVTAGPPDESEYKRVAFSPQAVSAEGILKKR